MKPLFRSLHIDLLITQPDSPVMKQGKLTLPLLSFIHVLKQTIISFYMPGTCASNQYTMA